MFRVHTPIIRSIRCWVATYGFLHQVCGWVVVLRAAAWVVCAVRMVPCESYGTVRIAHTTHSAALKTTAHPKSRCRKPYAATQHLMLLMMGICYVPETYQSKNTSIKLPCCIKLAFHFISWGRGTVKQPSCNTYCFSTETMVARTSLCVTLYVHCLSCFIIFQRLQSSNLATEHLVNLYWRVQQFLFENHSSSPYSW